MAYYGIHPRRSDTQLEDDLTQFMKRHGRDRRVHADLVWMARQYGLEASFSTRRKWSQIRNELRAGRPVIVSGKYTDSGHIIVIVGLRGEDFIVYAPWGNALTGYRRRSGRALLYPFIYMQKKTRKQGVDSKWAHFVRPG